MAAAEAYARSRRNAADRVRIGANGPAAQLLAEGGHSGDGRAMDALGEEWTREGRNPAAEQGCYTSDLDGVTLGLGLGGAGQGSWPGRSEPGRAGVSPPGSAAPGGQPPGGGDYYHHGLGGERAFSFSRGSPGAEAERAAGRASSGLGGLGCPGGERELGRDSGTEAEARDVDGLG
eukprot:153268-Prorocentrum_minimum.AAC.1